LDEAVLRQIRDAWARADAAAFPPDSALLDLVYAATSQS